MTRILKMDKRCRACESKLILVKDFGDHPIAHKYLTHEEKHIEKYNFNLHLCENCGLVQVYNPIPAKKLYSGFNYNFSSWKQEPHFDDELDMIFNSIKPASVCEVGANDGKFLKAIKERGVKVCIGIEPNPEPLESAKAKDLVMVNSFLNKKTVKTIVKEYGRFDLVVFRQVLEHVHDLPEFFSCVNKLLNENGSLFIDVPDLEPSRTSGDVTTLWEEHVSYFTKYTLINTLNRFGFKADIVETFDFSGGCLSVLATKVSGKSIQEIDEQNVDLKNEIKSTKGFINALEQYQKLISDLLKTARNSGYKIFLYGSGVRACAAMSFLGLENLIDYVIDDQPEKKGLFMPHGKPKITGMNVKNMNDSKNLFLLAVNNESESKVINNIKKHLDDFKAFSICSPKNIIKELQAVKL